MAVVTWTNAAAVMLPEDFIRRFETIVSLPEGGVAIVLNDGPLPNGAYGVSLPRRLFEYAPQTARPTIAVDQNLHGRWRL